MIKKEAANKSHSLRGNVSDKGMSFGEKKKALCPVFGKCGNCTLLNIPYEKQLQQKQREIIKLLGEFGQVEQIIGMKNPMYMRYKVHRVVGWNSKQEPALGNYLAGTHRFIPMIHCPLESERCTRVLQTIETLLHSFKITPYDEDIGRGNMRHILLREGRNTGELMVVLVAPSFSFPGKNHFAEALLAKHPDITTIVLNCNHADTNMVLGNQEIVLYGEGVIHEKLCGCNFTLSPQSFFQVNPEQTEVLYQTAIEFAKLTPSDTVVDAYCGTGTIGLSAAAAAKQIIGFELSEAAVKDAKQNALQNHINNAAFYCGDAGACLAQMVKRNQQADVILLDPPRNGSTTDFLNSAARMNPSRMVYISCGPQSLARDLKILRKLGYSAERIQPVDMFPHTEHVETVVLLVRKTPDVYVRIKMDMEDFGLTRSETKATHGEIKTYAKEQTGLNVSNPDKKIECPFKKKSCKHHGNREECRSYQTEAKR